MPSHRTRSVHFFRGRTQRQHPAHPIARARNPRLTAQEAPFRALRVKHGELWRRTVPRHVALQDKRGGLRMRQSSDHFILRGLGPLISNFRPTLGHLPNEPRIGVVPRLRPNIFPPSGYPVSSRLFYAGPARPPSVKVLGAEFRMVSRRGIGKPRVGERKGSKGEDIGVVGHKYTAGPAIGRQRSLPATFARSEAAPKA